MLGWSLGFLVLSLVSALLGFGGVAAASAGPARILFILSLLVFVITFIIGLTGPRRPSH